MLVKIVALGNCEEAFVEDRFTDNVNVIFSNDNNKGKTLVIQGLMYSIGYDSIFPSTFNYKDYYFYSMIEIDGKNVEFLRKNKTFIVRIDGIIQLLNSVSELKYFIDEQIFKVPRISKDNRTRVVDLSLFYEVFFIGQDNRNPSNLISRGQFNKSDFTNMVFSIANVTTIEKESLNPEEIKREIAKLKQDSSTLNKKLQIKKKAPQIATVASKSYENEAFLNKKKRLQELHKNITELSKQKTRELNRKTKLENLLSELNSLNRNLDIGSVKCADCGSDKIIYSNSDLSFEVSNNLVRSNIKDSIRKSIIQKENIIYDLGIELNNEQDQLTIELKDTPPQFQEIIVYQDEILFEEDIDKQSFQISKQIENLQEQLAQIQSVTQEKKDLQKELLEQITEEMADKYSAIDPNGNLEFSNLFSKKDATFSGSESQEFYFCKLLALNKVLGHKMPLIVDSFRDGELSSQKEELMLKFYKTLKKQVILTSTLKKEEYVKQKYTSSANINALDYSVFADCKILQVSYSEKFNNILNSFDGLIV